MLLLIGFAFILVFSLIMLLIPALWVRPTYDKYREVRAVTCPETGQQVGVRFDAVHAALTAVNVTPDLRLADCTRWPEHRNCDQGCMPEALKASPYTTGEVKITKRIYHLPILLAAFVAWYIGAVWHSEYLFRARWMADLGLTPSQLKDIVVWYSPHLLTSAVCLLFAYGVGLLLAIRNRKGTGQGILTALLLWGAVALASWRELTSLPHDLVRIELSYSAIAAIAVGALIGGLNGRIPLIIPASNEITQRTNTGQNAA